MTDNSDYVKLRRSCWSERRRSAVVGVIAGIARSVTGFLDRGVSRLHETARGAAFGRFTELCRRVVVYGCLAGLVAALLGQRPLARVLMVGALGWVPLFIAAGLLRAVALAAEDDDLDPDTWEPPRCRHGRILLGCPHDDCPEQLAYLAGLEIGRRTYEARGQVVEDPTGWLVQLLFSVAPTWAVEHCHGGVYPRVAIEVQPIEGEPEPRLTYTCGECHARVIVEPGSVAGYVASGAIERYERWCDIGQKNLNADVTPDPDDVRWSR